MKKKYNTLWRAGENMVTSIALTAAMLVLRIVQMPGITKTEIRSLASVFFSASLLFIAVLIFSVNIINWYYVTDTIKISMGITRKKVFMDMQITKLISAAGIYGVILLAVGNGSKSDDMQWLLWGFVPLMIFQTLAELGMQIWFRFRKTGVILMTAASAVFGFSVAYGVMKFMKKGILSMGVEFEILRKTPLVSVIFILLVYHVMVFVSWKLWEKAEITL